MPGGKEGGGGFFQSHWLAVLQWTRESLSSMVDTAEARHGIAPPSYLLGIFYHICISVKMAGLSTMTREGESA